MNSKNTMNSISANRAWLGATMALLSMVLPSASAALKVTGDEDNVVSSRLEGRWTCDKALSKRFGASDSAATLSFRSDEDIIRKIPNKYVAFLEGRTIYMAGTFTRNKSSHPFILIEVKGNPHIVYFRERDGDPLGDAESFNVMLPVAADRSNDLLFVGGDFNNQPFVAFQRVGGDETITDREPATTGDATAEDPSRLKPYLGSWGDKDKTVILKIDTEGFLFKALQGDKVEKRGKIELREDRLVIGSPDDDGGYVVLSNRGTLFMKQEHSNFELELSKID